MQAPSTRFFQNSFNTITDSDNDSYVGISRFRERKSPGRRDRGQPGILGKNYLPNTRIPAKNPISATLTDDTPVMMCPQRLDFADTCSCKRATEIVKDVI
jgi:hypothetical protein